MKLFLNAGILFIIFFFLGCYPFGYQLSRDEKLADEITKKTAKKLQEQNQLFLVGTGGQMMDDIKMMAMSFDYYQEVTLETARELIVLAINEYILAINSNSEIRSYLHESPFTSKNVEIRIWFYNPERYELPLGKIYYINSINGMIKYYTRSEPRQLICEETYEEALQKTAL